MSIVASLGTRTYFTVYAKNLYSYTRDIKMINKTISFMNFYYQIHTYFYQNYC